MKRIKLLFAPKDFLILLFTSVLFFSCCTTNKSSKQNTTKKKSPSKNKLFNVINPQHEKTVYFDEPLLVELKSRKNILPDSVTASIGNEILDIQKEEELKYLLPLNLITAGRKNITLTLYFNDTLNEKHNVKIVSLPKESPKNIQYEVIRSFYHDPESYTQGLLYHKGYLYESTGQPNRSSVRKVDPENGEVLRKKDLESKYFGEGLSLLKDELYMLTYHAQKVFVFDLETFEEKRSYKLQTREGWGMEYNGKEMVVSDGSATLYYFEPEHFTLEKQIEICDNRGLVHSLNELELTPYGLFSNIYTKNDIVLIDTDRAIVTGILDLSGLIPENVPRNADYCLNGIAYNKETKTFYVTGKQWPIMYEIKLIIDS
jgi:glutamine cyclotransferase